MSLNYTSVLAAVGLFVSASAHSINVPPEEQNPLQNGQPLAQIPAVEVLVPGLVERIEAIRQALHAQGNNGNNLGVQLGIQPAPGAPLVVQAAAVGEALQQMPPQLNLFDHLFQQ